jgi:hypothetical protein
MFFRNIVLNNRMNRPLAPLIMKGGSKAYVVDILKKYATAIDLYIISALVIAIVFVKEIPLNIRALAGSALGRLAIFFGTVLLADNYSWITGLLMAILSLLLLSLGPRTVQEGFQAPYSGMKLITDKEKWWVERVFKENPIAIQEDSVETKAIQDGSNGSSSTSAQGGSHH